MPTGYSLHLGLNEINPKHYNNWNGKLNCCTNDANAMHAIAKAEGYKYTKLLLDKQATKNNLTKVLQDYSNRTKSGDILFISYAGHGGSLPDLNKDEKDEHDYDRKDETWCLYDGQIIDDELNSLYSNFKQGVRILVISDSCHSGTVTRYNPTEPELLFKEMLKKAGLTARQVSPDISRLVYLTNKKKYDKRLLKKTTSLEEIKASVLLLAGCQDNQKAYESEWELNGSFTSKILEVWNDGKYPGDYKKFFQRIVAKMPDFQTPNFYQTGNQQNQFDSHRPFKI